MAGLTELNPAGQVPESYKEFVRRLHGKGEAETLKEMILFLERQEAMKGSTENE